MKPMSFMKVFKYFFLGLLINSFLLVVSCEDDNTIPEIENKEQNTGTPVTKNNNPSDEKEVETPPAPIIVSDPSTEELTEAQKILALVNKERTQRGLNTIVLNKDLNSAAFNHSKDMNDNNFFDHKGSDNSDFSTRVRRTGYKGFARAENIASGYRTAQSVHNGWMNSDGHRGNILLPDVTEMGIGKSGTLWTQVFGRTR